MKHTRLVSVLVFLSFMLCAVPAGASLANVYIAATAQGGDTGVDCTNAHSATWFNTSGNWGSGAGQIGAGTTVHLCGTFTGGTAATLLKFQGSGSVGNPVTLYFETGAIVEGSYCGDGCIDLNNKSYIVIDGGPTCGETSHWSTTACNGLIRNTLAGSSGQTCPAGPCTYQLTGTSTIAIGSSSGSPSHIEVRNLEIGPLYVRAWAVNGEGVGAAGLGLHNGTLAQDITMHHCVLHGMNKGYVVSMGSSAGTYSGYHFYNNRSYDQCWAMGVGANSNNVKITNLTAHDNEVSDWTNWALDGAICHGNGIMWFNGDGYTIHANGTIGDSTSMMYNNYMYGDLTGGALSGSPSGFLSPQDNAIDLLIFNNIVYDTCTGSSPTRSCGIPIYLLGPGGGGQQVYNNTVKGSAGENCAYVVGYTAPVLFKNNICDSTRNGIRTRGASLDNVVTSDYNVAHITNASNWICNNAASCKSLAQWQAYGPPGDVHSTPNDPLLDGNYTPQAGSSATNLGTNLTGLGITPLNSDAAGVARPAIGAWDAGAFQFMLEGPRPNPPTNMRATTVN